MERADPRCSKITPQHYRSALPCLTVGMMFLVDWLLCFSSKRTEHHCDQTILYLSHQTIIQIFKINYYYEHDHWHILLALVNDSCWVEVPLYLGHRPCNFASCKVLDTVFTQTSTPSSDSCFCRFFLVTRGLIVAVLTIFLRWFTLRKQPARGIFAGDTIFLYFLIIDWIVDFRTCSCSDILL